MKKIISFAILFIVGIAFSLAQESKNTYTYLQIQGGGSTSLRDAFSEGYHGVDLKVGKYLNEWLIGEIQVRGNITAPTKSGEEAYTFFDSEEIGINAKASLAHLLMPASGHRYYFEPEAYFGFSWIHYNPSNSAYWYNPEFKSVDHLWHPGTQRNMAAFRTGVDFNCYIDSDRKIALVFTPDVCWYNLTNMHFNKLNAQLSLYLGVRINFGEPYKYKTVEKVVEKTKEIIVPKYITETKVEQVPYPTPIESTYVVQFAFDSDEIMDTSSLDKIQGKYVRIIGYASPEGGSRANMELSESRAKAVADYLKSKGNIVLSCEGKGAPTENSNRIVIVTVQ